MQEKDVSESTNPNPSEEAKKEKSTFVTNAFIIGFMVGIVIYSLLANTVGLVTLIPLFIIYKLVNKPKEK